MSCIECEDQGRWMFSHEFKIALIDSNTRELCSWDHLMLNLQIAGALMLMGAYACVFGTVSQVVIFGSDFWKVWNIQLALKLFEPSFSKPAGTDCGLGKTGWNAKETLFPVNIRSQHQSKNRFFPAQTHTKKTKPLNKKLLLRLISLVQIDGASDLQACCKHSIEEPWLSGTAATSVA